MDSTTQKKSLLPSMTKKQRWDIIFVYCLLAPSIITALIFYIYVNLSSFGLAFTRNEEFAGWYNFELLLDQIKTPGSTLSVSVENTLLFFLRNLAIFVWGIMICERPSIRDVKNAVSQKLQEIILLDIVEVD